MAATLWTIRVEEAGAMFTCLRVVSATDRPLTAEQWVEARSIVDQALSLPGHEEWLESARPWVIQEAVTIDTPWPHTIPASSCRSISGGRSETRALVTAMNRNNRVPAPRARPAPSPEPPTPVATPNLGSPEPAVTATSSVPDFPLYDLPDTGLYPFTFDEVSSMIHRFERWLPAHYNMQSPQYGLSAYLYHAEGRCSLCRAGWEGPGQGGHFLLVRQAFQTWGRLATVCPESTLRGHATAPHAGRFCDEPKVEVIPPTVNP